MWWLFFKFTFWAKTDLVLVLNHDVNTSWYIIFKRNYTFTIGKIEARRQASNWRARECAPNMTDGPNEKLRSYAHFQIKLFQVSCFYPLDIFYPASLYMLRWRSACIKRIVWNIWISLKNYADSHRAMYGLCEITKPQGENNGDWLGWRWKQQHIHKFSLAP